MYVHAEREREERVDDAFTRPCLYHGPCGGKNASSPVLHCHLSLVQSSFILIFVRWRKRLECRTVSIPSQCCLSWSLLMSKWNCFFSRNAKCFHRIGSILGPGPDFGPFCSGSRTRGHICRKKRILMRAEEIRERTVHQNESLQSDLTSVLYILVE